MLCKLHSSTHRAKFNFGRQQGDPAAALWAL